MDWCRLWHDAPDDPKWRVIARKAGVRTGYVWSVWCRMIVNASKSSERGQLDGWDDEVEAVALDYEHEEVQAIRDAMQGKVLDGNRLIGWEKRQPKREDNSAERVKRYRKSVTQCNAGADNETQNGADVTPRNAPDKIRLDTDKKTDTPPVSPPAGGTKRVAHSLPEDWSPGEREIRFALSEGLSETEAHREADRFRDHWLSKGGKDSRKTDWYRAWCNWCREAMDRRGRGRGPPRPAANNDADAKRREQKARIFNDLGLSEMDHVASETG